MSFKHAFLFFSFAMSAQLFPEAAYAWDKKVDPFVLGARSSSNLSQRDLFERNLFFTQKASVYYDNEISGAAFNYQGRLSSDFGENSKSEFAPQEVSLSYRGEEFSLAAGLQVISFSETFGVNIMDVVNPRDYRLGVLDDLEWSKLSVPLLVAKYLGSNWNFETYFSPYGRGFKMADEGSTYDAYPAGILKRKQHRSHKMEGGVRFNYLTELGVDLNFIFYRHMNRRPFYYLDGMDLVTNDETVNSLGMTYSYSLDSLVFRGDYLLTLRAPGTKADATLGHTDLHQAIVGADWSHESGITIGGQFFYNSIEENTWGALQLQKTDGNFLPSLMIFYGISNGDRWVRPEFTYRGIESFEVRLRADILQGKDGEGQISSLRNGDRVELQFRYFY